MQRTSCASCTRWRHAGSHRPPDFRGCSSLHVAHALSPVPDPVDGQGARTVRPSFRRETTEGETTIAEVDGCPRHATSRLGLRSYKWRAFTISSPLMPQADAGHSHLPNVYCGCWRFGGLRTRRHPRIHIRRAVEKVVIRCDSPCCRLRPANADGIPKRGEFGECSQATAKVVTLTS